jgi:hypothetical protein
MHLNARFARVKNEFSTSDRRKKDEESTNFRRKSDEKMRNFRQQSNEKSDEWRHIPRWATPPTATPNHSRQEPPL